MRVHWLQHVPFEGLGSMQAWFEQQGHRLSCTRLWNAEQLPTPDAFDWLVIMGGPMGIRDELDYPWLIDEKRLIRSVISCGRHRVLGICLGAQLIADALGAPVMRNPVPELGWADVHCDTTTAAGSLAPDASFEAFHWHFDTFALPELAQRLYYSADCANQAFVYAQRVVGLQFHLETRYQDAQNLILHGAEDIAAAGLPDAQVAAMLRQADRFIHLNRRMDVMLEAMQAA